MRHIRLQHQRLATAESVLGATRLYGKLALEAVNHDVAVRSMLSQLTTRLEGEEQQPERSPVNQSRLAMAAFGRVSLVAEGAGEFWKVECSDRSNEAGAWMRP